MVFSPGFLPDVEALTPNAGISPCYQTRGRIKPLATKTMGQQTKAIVKRRRRKLYLKRKKEQVKLGGVVKKSSVAKKSAEGGTAAWRSHQ